MGARSSHRPHWTTTWCSGSGRSPASEFLVIRHKAVNTSGHPRQAPPLGTPERRARLLWSDDSDGVSTAAARRPCRLAAAVTEKLAFRRFRPQPLSVDVAGARVKPSLHDANTPTERKRGIFGDATLRHRQTAKRHQSRSATQCKTGPAPFGCGARPIEIRRRPTLPGDYSPSTIGAGGLNFRVRNGNGCISTAMATGNLDLRLCSRRSTEVDLRTHASLNSL